MVGRVEMLSYSAAVDWPSMASPALQFIPEHHDRSLVPTLVEELLEEIFLRLPTPDALARVSTACASFHCIITARAFLHRFRKLHPPPLLGFLLGGFHPAEAPHPSAPLARAVASAADFSYSIVPPRKALFGYSQPGRDGSGFAR
jgi:hypothetical protein